MIFTKMASSKKKAAILAAILKSEFANFYESFATQDFVPIYCEHRRYWASSIGDVTIIIWERGTNVDDWRVQLQCW